MSENKKIIEYYLLRKEFYTELSNAVDYFIKQGWQPFGSPFSDIEKNNEHRPTCLCQAMVKYESE